MRGKWIERTKWLTKYVFNSLVVVFRTGSQTGLKGSEKVVSMVGKTFEDMEVRKASFNDGDKSRGHKF